MIQANNTESNNSFYQNVKETLETIEEDYQKEEYENFLVNGQELSPEAQIIREKNRLLLNFTHLSGQSFDFVKHNHFRLLLDEISEKIDSGDYDIDILKKIIVHMDLELGIEVMFVSTFLDMLKPGIDNLMDYSKHKDFNYDNLYAEYDKEYKKIIR